MYGVPKTPLAARRGALPVDEPETVGRHARRL